MKKPAQVVCAVLSIAIVLKSFFKLPVAVDAINLIALVSVYCMYEFLTEKKFQKDLVEMKEANEKKFEDLQKDVNDTKNYMSKVSTSIAFRK